MLLELKYETNLAGSVEAREDLMRTMKSKKDKERIRAGTNIHGDVARLQIIHGEITLPKGSHPLPIIIVKNHHQPL